MPTNQSTNQTPNQPTTQAETPKKKSKLGLCILIAVIVVLLIAAAIFGLVYFVIKDAGKEFNEFFDTSTNVQEMVAPTPSKTASPQTTPRTTPQITPIPSQQKFSQAATDYFVEIVLGSEFGTSDKTLKKWVKNPAGIKINGNPDSQALICLDQVITDFNNLSTSIKLQKNNNSNDIQMYFAPKEEFLRIEPNYIPGNEGFFWEWWNDNNEFYKANILITTNNNITQKERCHIIREELTQSMGMANDSYRYPDSIFYIKWTDTTSYSALDQDVIRMLYATDIRLGATEQEVRKYFQ